MDVQIGEGYLLDLQKWPCIDIVVTRYSGSENDGPFPQLYARCPYGLAVDWRGLKFVW